MNIYSLRGAAHLHYYIAFVAPLSVLSGSLAIFYRVDIHPVEASDPVRTHDLCERCLIELAKGHGIVPLKLDLSDDEVLRSEFPQYQGR